MRPVRLLSLIIMFVSWSVTAAQSLSVESFRLLENDLTANTYGTIKYDGNGNVAALIKVVTTENGFNFDVGSMGVVATSQQKGEIWVYVPGGIQRITITHSKLGELKDYYFPVPIERARTYELKLLSGTVRTVVGEDASFQGSLQIESDPINSAIWLDDVYEGKTPLIIEKMTVGNHKILVRQEGYNVKELEIVIEPGKLNMQTISLTKSEEKGHTYVDLGLSVKWATCNIGAVTPQDFGGYYAWGEVKSKDNYTWSTYKYCEGTYLSLIKYCDVNGYGNMDNRTVLGIADDVAASTWRGKWRMPTNQEFEELIANCTWISAKVDNVTGFLVKGTKPGYTDSSIFLPAGGYYKDYTCTGKGSMGAYWSGSLGINSPHQARGIYFSYGGNSALNQYGPFVDSRCYGLSVRAVCP